MSHPMTSCVLPGKRHAADHGYVCRRHLEQMGTTLRDIEDQAAMISAVPSMQIRSGSRGGGLASQRTPVRLDVVVHKDIRHGTGKSEEEDEEIAAGETLSILGTLHSWARLVRDDRELAPPASVTISGERDLLSRQLLWIAEQDWVDEFSADIRKLLTQLKGSNGTADDKPIGRCWHPNGDEQCDGFIRRAASVSQPWTKLDDRCVQIDIQTADGHAYCERCGCTWDGPQIAMLNYELERAKRPKDENGTPLWSAAEIAEEHRVKEGTINVWAHRRGIVSVQGYWDPRAFRREGVA